MKKELLTKFSILLVACFLFISGCSLFPNKTPKEEKVQLEEMEQAVGEKNSIKKFSDYQELAEFLEEQAELTGTIGYGGGFGEAARNSVAESLSLDVTGDAGAPIAKTFGTDEGTSADGSSDYSKTNIQVEGVDEADIVKTDGEYMYIVARNTLYIVKALPADAAEVLAKIEFDARPENIYINNDSLVVFGRDFNVYTQKRAIGFVGANNSSFFKVFDISNKENPTEVRDLKLEGNYVDSRMIGDYVYFVVSNYNYYSPGEPIIPRILEKGEVLSSVCAGEERCFAPDVYYFDIPYDSYNFTTVAAVNVVDNNAEVKGDVYVLSGNQGMYVSTKNLYITYTEYLNEYELRMGITREMIFPKLSDKNKKRIKDIEAVDKLILTDSEKLQKISQIIERYIGALELEEQERLQIELAEKMKIKYREVANDFEKTIIHKIAINNGDLEYKVFGEVPGYVLNQFSMDESGDYFRIATTRNRRWTEFLDEEERESYSNLFVLDQDLKVVGAVEKIAKGESIYSVRFMQDRAYMVTFKQVDPLFVIDLKDPVNPQILGKLKIPGFSNYLHPYNDDLLIGIGKDTTEEGSSPDGRDRVRTLGVKLSLFNVADVGNPTEVDTYVLGGAGSDSIALYDHKAFLFSLDKNLLAIPVTIREDAENNGWGKLTFSGAAVFDISEQGFKLRGQIDHSDGGKEAGSDCLDGYCYYDNNVLRALYINDTLYTVSNNYLKMNKLSDLKLIDTLELGNQEVKDIQIEESIVDILPDSTPGSLPLAEPGLIN